MYIKKHKRKYYFSYSPDEDFPAGEVAAVFTLNDDYLEEGLTHGLLSHAIKHLDEFYPDLVKEIVADCIKVMKLAPKIWLINKSGQIIEQGIRAKARLSYDIALNSLDLVNDKVCEKKPLTKTEKKLASLLNVFGKSYCKLIDSFSQKAIDVNQVKSLEVAYNEGEIIKFTGEYQNKSFVYYLCFKTSAICVLRETEHNCIMTLFRIDKDGNDLSKICSYLTGMKIQNPTLSGFIKNNL